MFADHRRRRLLVRDDRGSAALEMAFIAPVFLLLVFFGIQAGLWAYGRSVALASAREGVAQLRVVPDEQQAAAVAAHPRLDLACIRESESLDHLDRHRAGEAGCHQGVIEHHCLVELLARHRRRRAEQLGGDVVHPREAGRPVEDRQGEGAARRQHPAQLPEDPRRVGREEDHEPAGAHIEPAVGQVEVLGIADGFHVELVGGGQVRQAVPPPATIAADYGVEGYKHFGLLVDDMDRVLAHFARHGVGAEYDTTRPDYGQRIVLVKEPNGYFIELYAPLA